MSHQFLIVNRCLLRRRPSCISALMGMSLAICPHDVQRAFAKYVGHRGGVERQCVVSARVEEERMGLRRVYVAFHA